MSGYRIGIVNYLNTQPLVYEMEKAPFMKNHQVFFNYPTALFRELQKKNIDLTLLSSAALLQIPNYHIIGNYGIAAEGYVNSVGIFSNAPLWSLKKIYLDYQSCTSVALVKILLQYYWKQNVIYEKTKPGFETRIQLDEGALIIGNRALQFKKRFLYYYDLAEAWKAFTGKDFIFALWVADKTLDPDFIKNFNAFQARNITEKLSEIITRTSSTDYDLRTYYTRNIHYFLDDGKLEGLNLFLDMLRGKISPATF